MKLFFTPDYAKCGDVIPFYNEAAGRFDHFYLKNWDPEVPEEQIVHGWHRLSTVDHRHYEELPAGIRGGTGCILPVDGVYHMFYCTFDQDPPAQWARHAVSTDLEHWTDIPEDKFTADGVIYRKSDWRDPFVFWNEEEKKWWMLMAARENAPTERDGCVALCVSDDLSHWEYRKPFYAPRENQAANECPDLFKMGDWYYLVYSNYTDGFCTHYRMSRSINGPWIRPERDTFDGRAFYAAKTGSDGLRRYAYGWNHIEFLSPNVIVAVADGLSGKSGIEEGIGIIVDSEGEIVGDQTYCHHQYQNGANEQHWAVADAGEHAHGAQNRQ